MSALLIAGPTASGKSALAVRLAQKLGGQVINADSMQVYSDLHVLTARPTLDEMAGVPHHLFGHIDGAETYSVGRWLEDVATTIAKVQAAGAVPILVGGTGLYFKALVQGLSDIPAVDPAIRAEVRARAEGLTPQDLHAELTRVDPETAAGLRPSDPQRIIRALEVWTATGQPLRHFQAARQPPLLATGTWRGFFLDVDRSVLNARIDARFETMMAAGARDEVQALGQRRLDPALPVMRAHGVPGLLAALQGEVTLAEAITRGQTDTRHYAKRQVTFVRHQLPGFQWGTPEQIWAAA